jgi:hypothetical protein
MSQPVSPPAAGEPPPPAYPRRFGWSMRLFLSFLVFFIVFRSFTVLFAWKEWAKDLRMRPLLPTRLATAQERAKLARNATPDRPDPVREDLMESLDSVWEFFKPWPGEKTRAWIRSPQDLGKWAYCWTASRLEFVENVLGINQEWPMFSPSVSKRKWVARARLIYADRSKVIVRTHGDPEDLTRYSHWFKEKVLDHELKVEDEEYRGEECLGYCNLLAHRHARNKAGKPLKKIRLFMVRYDLTPPGEDPRAWLEAQTGPPENQQFPDFYEYDVASRHGKFLKRD